MVFCFVRFSGEYPVSDLFAGRTEEWTRRKYRAEIFFPKLGKVVRQSNNNQFGGVRRWHFERTIRLNGPKAKFIRKPHRKDEHGARDDLASCPWQVLTFEARLVFVSCNRNCWRE